MGGKEKLSDKELIYQLDGRPSFKVAFPLGFQHVLAMFTGNLAPILILSGVFKIKTDTMCNVCFRIDNFCPAVSYKNRKVPDRSRIANSYGNFICICPNF